MSIRLRLPERLLRRQLPEQVTKKNMYLSILVGTAAYMLLLRIL